MQVTLTIPLPPTILRHWRLVALPVLVALLTPGLFRPAPRSASASGSAVVAISAFEYESCALTAAGGVKCWGDNEHGQLGNGMSTGPDTCHFGFGDLACSMMPADVSGLGSGVSAISVGSDKACALMTVGDVKCWGGGGLGDSPTTGSSTPVDVTSGVAAISASGSPCAVTTGGGVKCWGGGLGIPWYLALSNTPVYVSGLTSGVSAVATGGDHTCALTTGGGVKCWGYNGNGQLGTGSNTGPETCGGANVPCSNSPVDVVGLTSGVTAIAVGGYHTCALTTGGGVECWGYNGYGQLGDGTTVGPDCAGTCSATPVDVPGLSSGVVAISAGLEHTCGLTTAGEVKCWGYNAYGQLGAQPWCAFCTPVTPAGLTSGVVGVAAGQYHTCAVTTQGTAKCWGYNAYGQLGNGTTTSADCGGSCSFSPVDVVGLGPKGPPQINIAKLGQYRPPQSCYGVYDGGNQTLLFQVCDNGFQGPAAQNAVCIGPTPGMCADEDPAVGSISVTVQPGDYHIIESQAPPNHALASGKQACDVTVTPTCALTVVDAPNTRPWFPWDVTGDGTVRVDDLVQLINHYRQSAPQ